MEIPTKLLIKSAINWGSILKSFKYFLLSSLIVIYPLLGLEISDMWMINKGIIEMRVPKKIYFIDEKSKSHDQKKGVVTLNVNFDVQGKEHSFKAYKDGHKKSIGRISFKTYRSNSYLGNYVVIGKCDFDLPMSDDLHLKSNKLSLSDQDRQSMVEELMNFDPKAMEILQGSDILNKMELIIGYLWWINPAIENGFFCESLPLMEKIQLIKQHKMSVLCAGIR